MIPQLEKKLEYLKEQFEIENFGRVERIAGELITSGEEAYQREGLFYLGLSLARQGAYGDALEKFGELVDHHPDPEKVLYPMFECHYYLGDFVEARGTAEQLHALAPQNPDYLDALISANQYLGDFAAVAKHCEQALALEPGNIHLISYMASAKIRLGQFREAIDDFLSIVGHSDVNDTDRAMIHSEIGYAYSKMERYPEAKDYLERALAADDSPAVYHNNLGFVLAQLGDTQKGLDLINQALTLDPDNSYAYKNRAKVFLQLRETEQAIEDLLMARELDYELLYDDEVEKLLAELGQS
jgi:tetratricopeptide (TPR) repeat protein